jgi:Carbamate kinase
LSRYLNGDEQLKQIGGLIPISTVLAFGGNALLPDPDKKDVRAEAFARALMQVMPLRAGIIILRIEATRDRIPPETLDVLVAETQGYIGYLISRASHNAMTDDGEVR